MAVAVKDYLESMKSVSSSVKQQTVSQKQSDLKTQQLLSQLIEAISYANSMSFKKKELNAPAKGATQDGMTTKQVLDMLKQQEKLIDQLAQGQKLSREQSKSLDTAINRFYEAAGAQEINYKKFAASLEKFALQGNLPEAVQTRLVNDSRDAHVIGKEQKDSQGVILPIVKKIRNLLEDSAETTKQFNKKLFVSLDQFREDFLNGLSGLAEELKTGSFLGNLLKTLASFLNGAGMLWMAFDGMFKEGNFKWGEMFKQLANIKKLFSVAKGLGKIKNLKQLSAIPDFIKGLKALKNIPKLIGKLGLVKGLGGGLFKAAKLGTKGLKKIPVLGTIMSLWMAKERWGRKDYVGALIELGSGFAALFPGVGTAISIALDLINVGRDTGFFSKAGDAAKKKLGNMNLKEDLLLSIPVVGPIVGLIKSVKLWKSGDKKGALVMAGKSFLSIIPGGAFVGDLLMSLFGLNANDLQDLEGSKDSNTSKGGGFKWPWQKDKKNKEDNGTGDGHFVDARSGTSYNPDFSTGDGNYQNVGADMSYMQPKLMTKLNAAANDMKKSTGRVPKITTAFRSNRYQASLWYRGRVKHEPGIYTPAPPVYDENINGYNVKGTHRTKRSGHMVGGAIDVANWRDFLPFAKKHGLSWMGNSDPVHFQINDIYEVPKAGSKSPTKDMSISKIEPKGVIGDSQQEPNGSVANEAEPLPVTFEGLMNMFNKFNQSLADSIQGSATPVTSNASVTPEAGPSSPSIENITSGTPAAATAGATATTANKAISTPSSNTNKPAPAQAVQTMPAQGNPDSIDTEIKDTDLALLNSLLFQ